MSSIGRAGFAASLSVAVAVAVMGGLPAVAQDSRQMLKTVCLDDYKAHCAAVQGGRIKRCMSDHAASLSENCRAALADQEAKKQSQQTK